MFGCICSYWSSVYNFSPSEPETFSLPAPVPRWPPGQGFASGRINLGEIEVTKSCRFEFIWGYSPSQDKKKGISFYKPVGIPDGFHCLGYYCQSNCKPFRGYVLLAKELVSCEPDENVLSPANLPALREPVDYALIWSSYRWSDESYEGCGFIWLPQPPDGYNPIGYVVTNTPDKPQLHEVRCVRADLTDKCETYKVIINVSSKFSDAPLQIWKTRPSQRGKLGRGISVGTFFCSSYYIPGEDLETVCLMNLDPTLHAMPNLDQIHALVKHYGPTVFFHPNEVHLPSSVPWFFRSGALLYRAGNSVGEPIDATGSNLPSGGTNDGEFWIDLPADERRNNIICGNLESAKLYVHVKPALGGTFTDIAMWVFCPFNGPGTLKIGPMNIPFSKVGRHLGDWEHFTLRICNLTGELWSIYFSQHSGGEWVDAYDLEYIEGNKAIVYSSKNGHASFPHPGIYLQGSTKLGIGIRNDAARSSLYVDSSIHYEVIAAEYLGDGVVAEPGWLQFMREWGPKVLYDSRTELNKVIKRLPLVLRFRAENICCKLPTELYGEEGPTGPKEKNNWAGDERG